MLDSQQSSGDTLVLPVDFFENAFSRLTPVPQPKDDPQLGPKKFSLRSDNQRAVLLGVAIAKAMLDVAKPERSPAQYIVEWTNQEQDTLKKLETEVVLTPVMIQLWTQFFREWCAEVTRVAPNRFRDALWQAAYSILRSALEIEQEHIEKVKSQNLAPASNRQSSGLRGQGASGRGGSVHKHCHCWRRQLYGQE